jgi:hypothetical protein
VIPPDIPERNASLGFEFSERAFLIPFLMLGYTVPIPFSNFSFLEGNYYFPSYQF